jgi:hypothetical protein
VTLNEILHMTVFNEHNLMSLNSAQESCRYSQLFSTIKLKGLYQTNQLDDDKWNDYQPFVADRRWIHALKLGLLTEDEFAEGGRDMDDEIKPNHVTHDPAEEEDSEIESYALEEANKLRKYISGTFMNKNEEADEELAKEIDFNEAVESIENEDDSPEQPAAVKEDTEDDEKQEAEAKIIELVASSESDEDADEEDTNSPFVSWLKSLPAVAGCEVLSSGKKDKSEKKKEEKKAKEKKKKKKEKDKKSDKKKLKKKDKKEKKKLKKAEKKKKEKKKKKKDKKSSPAFQDRLVNSILLNDSIASEPLAQLLHEHGHAELAMEMYERLLVKYPEKSSYFAALIQQLKEEQ